MDQYKMSSPIDTTAVPQSFTTFPVRVHDQDAYISQGYEAARGMFQRLVPEFNKIHRPHSAGPYGNFFSICWPEGETEKVKLGTEIIEALWIYDDLVEDKSYEEAQAEHARVRQVFDTAQSNGQAPAPAPASDKKSLMASIFKDFGPRMIIVDRQGAPRVIESLKTYLKEYDNKKKGDELNTISAYTDYRSLNVGFKIMESFMQWCLGLHIDVQATEQCKEYTKWAARVMALTNDFYSWEVERLEPGDRKWNAVPVIMNQYKLSEEDAKVFLKGMIVNAEQMTRRLGLELRKVSEIMNDYVQGTELMLGGNCFWSATCPRYNP